MRTLHCPPDGYPIALLEGNVYIPDFGKVLERAALSDAVAYIHSDLRHRRTEGHYYPFASSMESITRTFPEASVLIAPTHGWDNPGPMAETDEE